MWSNNIISKEFSRAFSTAMPHYAQITVLSISSALATAGVAAGMFAKNPIITAGSVLLGTTSVLGWSSVHAPAYEKELRENMKTKKKDQALIAKLQANERSQSVQIQLLQNKGALLSTSNEELQVEIQSSREKITKLEKIGSETHAVIEDLSQRTAQQKKDLQERLREKKELESELLKSAKLAKDAGELILRLKQTEGTKDLVIAKLEKQIVDLTGAIEKLRQS